MKAAVEPGVLHTALGGGEAVLIHTRTASFYTLNETGYRVWTLLAAGMSLAEVVRHVEREFDVESPSAAASVARLARELEAEGLIKLVDPGALPEPAA